MDPYGISRPIIHEKIIYETELNDMRLKEAMT